MTQTPSSHAPTAAPGTRDAASHRPLRVVPRLLADDLRAGTVVLLVTLVAAALLAAWPRAVQIVSDDIVSSRLGATTAITRDITSSNQGAIVGGGTPDGASPLPEEWQSTFGLVDGELRALRDAMPEPLRAGVLDPGFRVYSTPGPTIEGSPDSDVRKPTLTITQDPYLTDHVTLAEGRWPTAADAPRQWETASTTPLGVVLSVPAAERLAWEVDDVREGGGGEGYVLLGTYTADDPDAAYWAHSPAAESPYILDDPNFGVTLTAAAYRGPGADPTLERMNAWFEVDPSPYTYEQLETVTSQLRGFTAVAHPVASNQPGTALPFASELPVTLDETVRDVSATTTVVALLAAGPVAGLALLLLAAVRVIVTRRRPAVALARARGASGLQVRGLLAVEGLVLGLLGGGLGLLAAVLLLPTAFEPAALVGPLLAVVAPAVMLAASVPPAGLRAVREDSGARSSSRVRWVWEVLAVGLAATATVLVLRRGAEDTGTGTDPLLAATPALVALAAAVVVARVAPLLMAPVVRLARRGRGALGFVGAASATRDRRGQLPPLVGLVVAVTVAVLSTVLLMTVRSGLETEAWDQVGADLRSTGPIVDDEVLEQVRGVPGVAAAATIADVTPAALSTGDDRLQARVLLVDPAALADTQSDVPGWEVPDLASAGPDGSLRAVVSSSFDLRGGTTVTLDNQQLVVDVVDQREDVPGGSSTSNWVLMDRAAVSAVTGAEYRPRVLLVRFDEGTSGAREAAVVEQVSAITGARASELRSDAVERRLNDPALAGLQGALVVATLVALLVGAATIVLSEVMATGRRERLFAVLKILGMPARGPRVIAAWEVAAWAVPALVAGAVLGALLPLLVAAAVDLSAFTGGASAPPLVYDPLALVGVVGVFVVVVGACGLVSSRLGRRISSAATLRSVQE